MSCQRELEVREEIMGMDYIEITKHVISLEARIAELEYALELVASGELMYPEQTARQALQEQEK